MWYKAESVLFSEPATFANYVVRDTILSIVKNTLNDLENVKHEGNGKYSYTFTADNYIALAGYNDMNLMLFSKPKFLADTLIEYAGPYFSTNYLKLFN